VRVRSYPVVVAGLLLLVGTAACAKPPTHTPKTASAASPAASLADSPSPEPPSPSASPSPWAAKSPTRTPAPKPTTTLKKTVSAGADTPKNSVPPPTNDGVPTHGTGTFSVAGGGTDVAGAGTTLVKYRVEVEDGIAWGNNPVWTAASFAATVDQIIAAPRGWTNSAQSPITDADEQMTNASWSFQRVS
jgi:hypothetical protein